MPEAVRAVERETDVVDGAPLFVEREGAARRRGSPRGEPGRGRRARRGRGLHVPQLRLHDVRQPELPADVRQVRGCRTSSAAATPTATGARGAGKSVALAQIVTQARAAAGSAFGRARGRRPPRRLRRAVAAPRGCFEEPRSREVLEAFREAHGNDLATVECTDAAAERRGGATLREVVGAALDDKKRGDEASTALADVVDGLRAHDGAGIDRGRRVPALFEPATYYTTASASSPTTSCTSARCGLEMPAPRQRRPRAARTCSPTRSRAAAPASGRATGASASPTRPSRSPSASSRTPSSPPR